MSLKVVGSFNNNDGAGTLYTIRCEDGRLQTVRIDGSIFQCSCDGVPGEYSEERCVHVITARLANIAAMDRVAQLRNKAKSLAKQMQSEPVEPTTLLEAGKRKIIID